MSVRPMEPTVTHRAYCTECGAVLEDVDVDRLFDEGQRHEKECSR